MSICKSEIEIDSHIAETLEGLLAECIKKYPIIYDRNHQYHLSTSFPDRHQAAWDQISDELNLETNSCKILWNGIKQKFIKYRKKIDKNEFIFKEWPIFDNLRLWLDPHIKRRRTKTDMYKNVKTPPANKITFFKDIETVEWNGMSDDEESINNEDDGRNLKCKNVEIKKRKRHDDSYDSNVSTEMVNSKLKIEKISRNDLKKASLSSIRKDCSDNIFSEIDDLNINATNDEQLNVEHSLDLPKECTFKKQTEQKTYSSPIKNHQNQTETIENKKELSESSEDGIVTQQDILSIGNKNSNSYNVKENTHAELSTKLEEVVGKCVGILERCIDQNSNPNSGEVFGKYIASLVQEIPPAKRIKSRMIILEFVTDLVAKELNGQ